MEVAPAVTTLVSPTARRVHCLKLRTRVRLASPLTMTVLMEMNE